MYFTNLNNPELQYFKKLPVPNFSISLEGIMHSKLFKVESICADMYRVYPLFYTNKITSSNNKDQILDNKCLIITKQEDKETYFNFIKNENEEIIAWNNDLDTYILGDRLSPEEFNAIIQLFRIHNSFTEELHIKNSLVNGDYADYQFDLESTTIVDKGILITKETLENIGTVKLINPVFGYSTYILNLKVYSVEDYNINLMDKNNIKVTELSIPLQTNTAVNIPFETLDMNNIVGFDASVNITHDKTYVSFTKHLRLNVTGVLKIGETLTLKAVYDESGTLLSGKTISFYDGETLLGTATTDDEGIATITYNPTVNKEYVFNVACLDDNIRNQSVKTYEIRKQDSELSLTIDKKTQYVTQDYTVSGVLTSKNQPLANTDVKLYCNGKLVDTLKTDDTGAYSKTFTADTLDNHNYQAVYDGTDKIQESSSNYFNINIGKIPYKYQNVSWDKDVELGDYCTVSGYVVDVLGNPLKGGIVTISHGQTSTTVTTASNGRFNRKILITSDNPNTISITGPSDLTHYSPTENYRVNVYKNDLILTVDNTKCLVDEVATLEVLLTDNKGNPVPNTEVRLYIDSASVVKTTNSDGEISMPVSSPNGYGTRILRAIYSNGQYGVTSNSITVSFKYQPIFNTYPVYHAKADGNEYVAFRTNVYQRVNGTSSNIEGIKVNFKELEQTITTNNKGLAQTVLWNSKTPSTVNLSIDETDKYYSATGHLTDNGDEISIEAMRGLINGEW